MPHRETGPEGDDSLFFVGYFVVLIGGVAAGFFLLDWLWTTFVTPLGLAWYWTSAIIFLAIVIGYVFAIWGMARNQVPHRVGDIRQKVRDDLRFLAIYTALMTPVILVIAIWNDALADVPQFFGGALLLGAIAKLRKVLYPTEF